MSKCLLMQRHPMYEVYIDGKLMGKGSLHYINTAYYFYKMEGMDVEIVYE
jgi:hypothetical protein